ncbi:hypothetical protein OEZ86_006051 [Tetradesmus obliquus]|uniref:EamA domain-containing protein n=1 Tax=Tetradesmus obliquus TaxID=3088 RepID=A0ABY8TWS8_TETOB|nr:hypothetical protein OEZ85_006364 [Tetradesmus obliquus]WIA32877.1 hypothetical protein OEZ86_006051 [Tetradesmus obliquus]
MAPADLIALVTVYDAVIATIGVLIVDNGLPDTSSFDKHTFYTVVTITAFGATLARLLYQRALSIAPLSLTVPYLAFTPAFVVLISPLFLVGESASPMGMLGVFVGSVVVYLLAIENILVSYVVAIKRVNVLLSTLIGCVLFKEAVGRRIPYILLMLCGMLLIVLQPGHEGLHHSHHTRHHALL